MWNRQRTDFDLIDPANTGLGHKQVQRWNLAEGWVISRHPAHPALVSEADFVAAQEVAAPRGPAGPAVRRYLLAGLLACRGGAAPARSPWSNGKPGLPVPPRLHQRHEPGTRPANNIYIREDQILPHLAAMAILLAGDRQASGSGTVQVTDPAQTADLIDQLRASGAVLTYDPDTRTIRAASSDPLPLPQAGTADNIGTTPRERRQNSQVKHLAQRKAGPG